MASLAAFGFRPPSCQNGSKRSTSAPMGRATIVRASSVTNNTGTCSAPQATTCTGVEADGKRERMTLNRKAGVSATGETQEKGPGYEKCTDGGSAGGQGGGDGHMGKEGEGGPEDRTQREVVKEDVNENSEQEDASDGDGRKEDSNLGDGQEETLLPDVVVVAFPSISAITKEPLISVVNSEGYSIVSKGELTGHFLPKGWMGTVILKPGGADETVRLSPSLDPDGGDYVWSLGAGEYIMEARIKETRSGLGKGSSGLTGQGSRGGMQGGARRAHSGYHSAAASFGSLAKASASISRTHLFGERARARTSVGGGNSCAAGSKKTTGLAGARRKSKTQVEKEGNKAEEEEEVESAKRDDGGKGPAKKNDGRDENVRRGTREADEWAKGIFGGGEEEEVRRERSGGRESVGRRDEWARGIFGSEGERQKSGRGIDAETLKEMKEAWGNGGEERSTNVIDGVLLSDRILVTNRLKMLLERTKPERVNGLEGPVNGNKVLLMDASAYSGKRMKDGRYWIGGQTTAMKTVNGETVRSWRCAGGMRCANNDCGYKKRFAKENLSGFEMRGTLRKWHCFHCDQEAVPFTEACQALKWTVKNDKEVAYCHLGEHNHDLGMLESKGDLDEHQMQVRSVCTLISMMLVKIYLHEA